MPGKVHYTASGLYVIRIEVLGAVCTDFFARTLFSCKKQAQTIIIAWNYLLVCNCYP